MANCLIYSFLTQKQNKRATMKFLRVWVIESEIFWIRDFCWLSIVNLLDLLNSNSLIIIIINIQAVLINLDKQILIFKWLELLQYLKIKMLVKM